MNRLRFLSIVAAILLLNTWAGGAQIDPSRGADSPPAASAPTEEQPAFQPTAAAEPAIPTLELEEAINRALEANRGILDARDGVESTRLSLVSAESEFELKFFPLAEAGYTDGSEEDGEENFGAGVSVQKKFSYGTIATLEPNVRRTDNDYQSRLVSSISQPLLRGRDPEFNLTNVRSAEFGVRSARRSLYLTRVSTVVFTVRAFYSVARQSEFMRVNNESVSRLKHHVEATLVKEKIGLATPIDVYRAKIELKRSEDNLARARQSYADAMDSLKVILAFPMEEKIQVSAPLEYSLITMDEKQAVELAFENRVELRQAWDAVKEAERQSRVAKHNILPDLNVSLSFTPMGDSGNFGDSLGLDEYTWGISLSSTTDFRRTAERAAFDQSKLSIAAAYRNLSLLRDEIAREAKSAVRALKEAEQRIAIQKEQIENAKGKLRLAQVKFKHGMANNFDLIEAEEQLRQAQTDMISVVIDYIVGTYDLRSAMGTLLEREAGL
jgi:outer membrane protein